MTADTAKMYRATAVYETVVFDRLRNDFVQVPVVPPQMLRQRAVPNRYGQREDGDHTDEGAVYDKLLFRGRAGIAELLRLRVKVKT